MTGFKALNVWALIIVTSVCYGQPGSGDLKIYGYFQNSFTQQYETETDRSHNSFNLQQLNIFLRKDIAKNWRTFINVQMLNNFSQQRRWGSINLEEAWVRYTHDEKFNIKLGLLIPVFNHLNEIKNKTPLLPYIVRPIVYETSFAEFIDVDEYTPERAFVQAYGFIPIDNLKVDYTVYLGNSPNISRVGVDTLDSVQSGQDTSDTILVGGRIGFRYRDLKLGFSYTRDNDNSLVPLASVLGGSSSRFSEVPRTRIGGDFSYFWRNFSFHSEFIVFKFANESEVDLERTFFYGTLAYRFADRTSLYVSYWDTKDILEISDFDTEVVDIEVPTFGISYNFNESISIKWQYALAYILARDESEQIFSKTRIHYLGLAASVIF